MCKTVINAGISMFIMFPLLAFILVCLGCARDVLVVFSLRRIRGVLEAYWRRIEAYSRLCEAYLRLIRDFPV